MPNTIGRGVVEVVYDKDQAEKSARDAIMPGLGRIAGDMAGLFAGKKIFDFAKQGFGELMEAEKVAALTASTIKATGAAAGVTSEQVGELAGSLSEMSGKDDELIQSGANLILTFKNIKNEVGEGNDVFDQATKAALNLSTAGFGSMESASVMLGKALNDPLKGVTALGRAGVTFSEEQKVMIRSLVETGDLLGAQKIILAEVEAQVGGAAEAYGDTLAGKMERAKNAMDETKASMVAGLAPALEFGATAATKFGEAFQAQPEILQKVEGGLLLVGGGIAAVARPINDMIGLFRNLTTAREAGAAAAAVAANVETAASARSVASAGAGAAATAAASGVKVSSYAAATVAIDAMIAGEVAAATASKGLLAAMGPVGIALAVTATALGVFMVAGDTASLTVEGLDQEVKSLTEDLSDLGKGSLGEMYQRLKDLVAANDDLAKTFAESGITVSDFTLAMKGGAAGVGELVQRQRDAGLMGAAQAIVLIRLAESQEKAAQAAIVHAVAQGQVTQAQVDSATASHTAADGTISYLGAINELAPSLKSTGDAEEDAKRKTEEHAAAIEAAEAALKDYTNALRASTDPLFAMLDASLSHVEAQKNVETATAAVTAAQKEYNDAVAQFGPTSDQAATANAALDAATRGMTDANIGAVQSASDLNVASATLAEQVRNGSVSVSAATTTLQGWVAQGLITQDQANQVAQKFTDVAALADTLQGTSVEMSMHLDDAQVQAALKQLGQLVIKGPNGELSIEVDIAAMYKGPRAAGGPVEAGMAYLVGEHRPELFVPDVPGHVYADIPPTWGGAVGRAGGNTYQLSSGPVYVNEPQDIETAFARLELLAGV